MKQIVWLIDKPKEYWTEQEKDTYSTIAEVGKKFNYEVLFFSHIDFNFEEASNLPISFYVLHKVNNFDMQQIGWVYQSRPYMIYLDSYPFCMYHDVDCEMHCNIKCSISSVKNDITLWELLLRKSYFNFFDSSDRLSKTQEIITDVKGEALELNTENLERMFKQIKTELR